MNDPCVRCGHETAAVDGTRVARMTIENLFGPALYLCEDCTSLLRASEPGRTLSDEEIRGVVNDDAPTWRETGA